MKIVYKNIKDNSLNNYVDMVNFDDTIPFARYFYNDKILSFNYDNIVKTIFISSNKLFNNKKDLIEYINLNILVIIKHEIMHIIQEKNINILLSFSIDYEEYLKKNNKYSISKYLNNPVERQANIYSLKSLLDNIHIQSSQCEKMIKMKLINYLQYGYTYDKFPLIYFFDNSNIYNLSFDWNSEYELNKIEYGLELNDIELFKLKRCIL